MVEQALTSMIVDALIVGLTTACQTNINVSDPTRAGLIQSGRHQDDPSGKKVILEVLHEHPEDEAWSDEYPGNLPSREGSKTTIFGSGAEIGGGRDLHRRFTVRITCFYVLESFKQDVAEGYAATVRARVEKTLRVLGSLGGLTDDFGETIWVARVASAKTLESGGPPDDYIWRSEIRLEYLTHTTD